MYKNRLIFTELDLLSKHFPVVVVTGARQVGKTTLLKELFGPTFSYVLLDPVQDIGNARADPDLFLKNHPTPLILDEIQYAPELVSAIKRFIDRDRKPGQYFLTGSQQWNVIRSMSESLAGRAVFLDLENFSLIELEPSKKPWINKWLETPNLLKDLKISFVNQYTAYEQIWRGWLPEAQKIPFEAVSYFHQAYQRSYIEKDIRLLTDLSDVQLFGRFTRLVAALTGKEINHSQLGREIGVTPQTARRWLDLLKAAYQWVEIPSFSQNTLKRISYRSKGYMTDTGMAAYLQAISTPEALSGHPLWGSLFETAVVNEVRKQLLIVKQKPNLFHWRAHSGAEVDLILEWNGVYYPIEVKGKTAPKNSDTSGIKAFREAYPRLKIAEGLVVSLCDNVYLLNDEGDYAFPWNAAL